MVATEGFGIATCKERRVRYHAHDYLGEGARGYARRSASDPMVWPDDMWRSSLMGGYARDYDGAFDLRFRRSAPVRRQVVYSEARVIISNAPYATAVSEPPPPRRAKAVRLGGGKTDVMENRVGFAGHRCPGVLVLTWSQAGSKARCYNDQGRIRTLR